MLPFACQLQTLQLIDGVGQLALDRRFVAQDAIQIPVQREAEMVLNRCRFVVRFEVRAQERSSDRPGLAPKGAFPATSRPRFFRPAFPQAVAFAVILRRLVLRAVSSQRLCQVL